MKTSVVLLSSGLDSTVNFYEAIKHTRVLLALTFDYGQRAFVQESSSAKRLCELNHVPWKQLRLDFVKAWGNSSLTHQDQDVPVRDDVQLDHFETSQKTAKSVWVPNRNGLFLNVAAGFAESLGADLIVPGFNLEEAQTFADNSEGFLKAMDHSLDYSTSTKVKTFCWTLHMTKAEIARRGVELMVPFQWMWPCYFGQETWCGECESCQRFKRGLAAAGLSFDELREIRKAAP